MLEKFHVRPEDEVRVREEDLRTVVRSTEVFSRVLLQNAAAACSLA